MTGIRYEVFRDSDHTGSDFLNVIKTKWPYIVRRYEGDQVYPYGKQVGIAATLKGAKKLIRKDKEAIEGIVYTEKDGTEILPDLRIVEAIPRPSCHELSGKEVVKLAGSYPR